MDRIARREHRGFDSADVVALLGRRLSIESVAGIPFAGLHPALNASVGIVGISRRTVSLQEKAP